MKPPFLCWAVFVGSTPFSLLLTALLKLSFSSFEAGSPDPSERAGLADASSCVSTPSCNDGSPASRSLANTFVRISNAFGLRAFPPRSTRLRTQHLSKDSRNSSQHSASSRVSISIRLQDKSKSLRWEAERAITFASSLRDRAVNSLPFKHASSRINTGSSAVVYLMDLSKASTISAKCSSLRALPEMSKSTHGSRSAVLCPEPGGMRLSCNQVSQHSKRSRGRPTTSFVTT